MTELSLAKLARDNSVGISLIVTEFSLANLARAFSVTIQLKNINWSSELRPKLASENIKIS